MLQRFALVCCAVLLVPVMARAGDVSPPDQGEGSTRAFAVDLGPTVAAADVIPAIVEAGHVQLAAACEQTPGGAVRILNPLASGDYVDVACADILGAPVDAAGQTSEALSSEPGGEPIGETQQKITPLGPFLCGLAGLIQGGALAKICSDWRGRDSQFCGVGGAYNAVLWLVMCSIAF